MKTLIFTLLLILFSCQPKSKEINWVYVHRDTYATYYGFTEFVNDTAIILYGDTLLFLEEYYNVPQIDTISIRTARSLFDNTFRDNCLVWNKLKFI